MPKKNAVVLFNLGGPDDLAAVKPFLFHLFYDHHIIRLPNPFRYLLAKFISYKREKKAKGIYQQLGGKSPLLENTEQQKQALMVHLNKKTDNHFDVYIAMRYWHPFIEETYQKLREKDYEHVYLLPLYPQFSTTTTKSSFYEWHRCEKIYGPLAAKIVKIGCYPQEELFITAHTDLILSALKQHKIDITKARFLFSAHGLPQCIVDKGDPYCWQVEETTKRIIQNIEKEYTHPIDYAVCYQSRVGAAKWVEPFFEDCLREAINENIGVIVIPISFVSEHSETIIELDVMFGKMAQEKHIPFYIRIPTLSTHPLYIHALAKMIRTATLGQINHWNNQQYCYTHYAECLCR